LATVADGTQKLMEICVKRVFITSLQLCLLLLVFNLTVVSADAETKVHKKTQPVVAELFVTSW